CPPRRSAAPSGEPAGALEVAPPWWVPASAAGDNCGHPLSPSPGVRVMASINKVILIGNLGRDPEVRYTPNGNAVCNVTVATSRNWKDKTSGDKVEETEWHRVVFYDRLAEIA